MPFAEKPSFLSFTRQAFSKKDPSAGGLLARIASPEVGKPSLRFACIMSRFPSSVMKWVFSIKRAYLSGFSIMTSRASSRTVPVERCLSAPLNHFGRLAKSFSLEDPPRMSDDRRQPITQIFFYRWWSHKIILLCACMKFRRIIYLRYFPRLRGPFHGKAQGSHQSTAL